ncbi:MAG: BrnT family toxin [Caldilineaceae bacterium]
MRITYDLFDARFEWDSEKAESNFKHHKVTFEEAAEVFFDADHLAGDASEDLTEYREYFIGVTFRTRLLLVVHTERRAATRIISACPASKAEATAYENSKRRV